MYNRLGFISIWCMWLVVVDLHIKVCLAVPFMIDKLTRGCHNSLDMITPFCP